MPNHYPEGLILIQLEVEELNVVLDCWFEYEPAQRGERERGTGLQLEPDYPATLTLCHVYLPGSDVDITPVMGPAVVTQLEEAAYERYGDGMDQEWDEEPDDDR